MKQIPKLETDEKLMEKEEKFVCKILDYKISSDAYQYILQKKAIAKNGEEGGWGKRTFHR